MSINHDFTLIHIIKLCCNKNIRGGVPIRFHKIAACFLILGDLIGTGSLKNYIMGTRSYDVGTR